jgi:uncharacterized coiled-coil protein SlyX
MSIELNVKVTELQERLTETEQALAVAINRISALEEAAAARKPGPKAKDSNG